MCRNLRNEQIHMLDAASLNNEWFHIELKPVWTHNSQSNVAHQTDKYYIRMAMSAWKQKSHIFQSDNTNKTILHYISASPSGLS